MTERRTFLKNASLATLSLSAPIRAIAGQDSGMSGKIVPAENSMGMPTQLAPIPEPERPKEHAFKDIHLLGQPEKNGNLLGELKRTTEWKSTKQRAQQELQSSADSEDPIHNWLNTFMVSFDERAAAIVLNTTASLVRPERNAELFYEPQLYDASLRSAALQLDRCLRYRNEMGGYELSGVSAAITYLRFLKTRPLQRNFILQSTSADVDDLQKSVAVRTAAIYGQARSMNKAFEKSIEKYQLLGLQSDAEGTAAESELTKQKDSLRVDLLERLFNINVDSQLAEFTRLLSPGTASNYAERYLRLLAYLTDDLADVYKKLYSASAGVAQALSIENVQSNGKVLPLAIPRFADSSSLSSWVQLLVPANPSDQRQPDVLDAFVLWTRAVLRELDRRSQYESEFTVSIPLNQPSGQLSKPLVTDAKMDAAFHPTPPTPPSKQAKPTGVVNFGLVEAALPFRVPVSDIRVVALGLSVECSSDDVLPVQFTSKFSNAPPKPIVSIGQTPTYDANPPKDQVDSVRNFELPKYGRLNAAVISPAQKMFGSVEYHRPPILLSNVRIQGGASGDAEPNLSFDPACKNMSPIGQWSLRFDKNVIEYFNSQAAITNNWITGLVLHLRLRVTTS
jgi:hypothetical protein